MSDVITLSCVEYSIGDKQILRNICLDVAEGSFLGIVGPNGGGKTTLLKIILGIILPDSGRVTVLGKQPRELLGAGLIGYLPQHAASDANFPATALDVVLMGCQTDKTVFLSRADRVNAAKYLDVMGMTDKQDRPFGSLSGGEQQRISIARALVSNPRVLILDEPSTGIDVIGQENFYAFLKGMRQEKRLTVIMVSHDIGAISAFVDDMACLNHAIHCHGAPGEIQESEMIKKMYGENVEMIKHGDVCHGCERLK